MSAVLFKIVIDWVMRRITDDKPRGIRWTLGEVLEDFDFADDLALVFRTHQHMQEKTDRLNNYAQQLGLNISKTEVMTLNITNVTPINVGKENLPTTESFKYLGSIVKQDGRAGQDIQNRLSKARGVFSFL